MTEEPVAGTDGSEEPKAEPDAPEEKGYEDYLNEYEGSPPEEQPKPQEKPDDYGEIKRRLDQFEQQQRSQTVRQAIEATISRFRESDVLKDLSDTVIKGWLLAKNEDNPKLGVAFGDQFSNPSAWSNIERSLRAEMEREFSSLPDRNLTADRQAAEAAARGVSTQAPLNPGRKSPEEEARLAMNSPAEWQEYLRGLASKPQE